jgi:hypothetical protein
VDDALARLGRLLDVGAAGRQREAPPERGLYGSIRCLTVAPFRSS